MLPRVIYKRQVGAELLPVQLWVHIPVKDAKCNDRDTGEDYVIELNVPFVKDGHRAETAKVCVEIVRHS